MSGVQSMDLQRSIESEGGSGTGRESVREEHRCVLVNRDEAGVERCIEMRREQQAVEDVEALGVGVAVGPGLDVARAQELRHPEAGDRATAVPVLEQATAKDFLADPLDLQTLGFRRPRQVRGRVFEYMKQRVRQRARELERAARQAMEFGDVADAECAGGAVRERAGRRRAEVRQPVEDIRTRLAARNRESPMAVSRMYIAVWMLPKESQPAVCSSSRSNPLSVAAFSRRVIVTAASITGLGPASSAATRRGCSRTREAAPCQGAERTAPRDPPW